jgi:hypothetical protein
LSYLEKTLDSVTLLWHKLVIVEKCIRGTSGTDIEPAGRDFPPAFLLPPGGGSGEVGMTEEGTIVARGKRGLQVRKQRRGGWTAQKKRRFLEALAATCNVRRACEKVGLSDRSAYAERAKDPVFREEWQTAIDSARGVLATMLIERSGRGGRLPEAGEDDTPFDDPATMDTALALTLIKQHEGGAARWRGSRPPRYATREQTDAEILRRLAIVGRRLGAAAA